MNKKLEISRFRIVYTGRVQGVGFRWQVKNVSESFEGYRLRKELERWNRGALGRRRKSRGEEDD